jgi:hypothetical protein
MLAQIFKTFGFHSASQINVNIKIDMVHIVCNIRVPYISNGTSELKICSSYRYVNLRDTIYHGVIKHIICREYLLITAIHNSFVC